MNDEPLVERVKDKLPWSLSGPTAYNVTREEAARAILLEVADAVEHNDEVWARIASYPDRSAVAGDGVYEVVRFLREQAAEEGASDGDD